MKKIVLTGATSLLGLAFIEKYSRKYEIHAVVRPGSRRQVHVEEYPGVVVHSAEMGSLGDIETQLGPADVFLHLGWDSSFEKSRYNDAGQEGNVSSTMSAVELSRRLSCDTFIGMGSQAECGRVSCPIDEFTPPAPENAYGRAKVKAVDKSTRLCEEYGIRCIWPRLLSAYGPFDRPHTLVMSCIDACIKRKPMNLTRCEQVWDYVYVDDVATVMDGLIDKGRHGVRYPIASGTGLNLYEYIDTIRSHFDCGDGILNIGGREYSDDQVMYLVGNTESLKRDIGYVPSTAFDEGIAKTISWVIDGGEETSHSRNSLLQ